jgi:hypothetical protein
VCGGMEAMRSVWRDGAQKAMRSVRPYAVGLVAGGCTSCAEPQPPLRFRSTFQFPAFASPHITV